MDGARVMCGDTETADFENFVIGMVLGFLLSATGTMLVLTKWVFG